MSSTARRWAVVALVVVVGLGIAGWAMLGGRGHAPQDAKQAEKDQDAGKAKGQEQAADAEYVMVGGVRRKRSDVEPAKKPAEQAAGKSQEGPSIGVSPPVPEDLNPQVKSAVEAIRTKKHPERLSALAVPAPFDRKAFEKAPEEYLNTVEPGRVFQTAQPGPGVSRLTGLSPALQRVTQGETVTLQVKAPPKSPVTFVSYDLGEFQNRLTTVTVQANEEGVAESRFTATPGTVEDVKIQAGSPRASGQVKFVVNVQVP